jgi:hypothetical protein
LGKHDQRVVAIAGGLQSVLPRGCVPIRDDVVVYAAPDREGRHRQRLEAPDGVDQRLGEVAGQLRPAFDDPLEGVHVDAAGEDVAFGAPDGGANVRLLELADCVAELVERVVGEEVDDLLLQRRNQPLEAHLLHGTVLVGQLGAVNRRHAALAKLLVYRVRAEACSRGVHCDPL